MNAEGLEVREGRTELIAPHEKGARTFIYPAFGPNNFVNVGSEISNAGLRYPTMAETASLVYAAWQNKDDKYSQEIIGKLKSNWLWANNGLLYVPKGAYIQDSPKVEKGRVVMEESELLQRLESNDKSVRFIPFGFKTEVQTAQELASNPFIKALAGEEGADKLAQVSGNYKLNPYLWSFISIEKPAVRVARLYSGWNFDGNRLDVCGSNLDDDRSSFAFGVSDYGEASAQKI